MHLIVTKYVSVGEIMMENFTASGEISLAVLSDKCSTARQDRTVRSVKRAGFTDVCHCP